MENSRNKQSVRFCSGSVLSSVMKPVVLLRPAQDVNRPFVQHFHAVCVPCPRALSRCLGDQINCHRISALVVTEPRFCLLRAPQRKSGDAAGSEMPKRSPGELPVREKVKVLNSNEERENCMLRLLRSVVRTTICEIA